jgi:hypothetical protein
MNSDAKFRMKWPKPLYAYMRFGWLEWLIVLAISAASVAWYAWNAFSLLARGSIFVLGARFGSPSRWAKSETEPLAVVVWSSIDLVWLLAATFCLIAASRWLAQFWIGFRSS